ncbi:hypothetical protein ACFXG6_35905 [Streptomyces roseus]|uniref:hypothetical protein n=1 Tax=Streptomyces roseus TaxID=66430 RepID=UPI0036C7229D
MSTATDPQPPTPPQHTPQPPPPPRAAADPLVVLLLVLVVGLVIGGAGYLCVAHPSLSGPVEAVAGVTAAMATVIGVVVLRQR